MDEQNFKFNYVFQGQDCALAAQVQRAKKRYVTFC